MDEDSHTLLRGNLVVSINNIVQTGAVASFEERVLEAWQGLAVKTPVVFLSYLTISKLSYLVWHLDLPAASSCFSSSVSRAHNAPFLIAAVTHTLARLKSPKLSLKLYQAKFVSIPIFDLVSGGGAMKV